MSRLAAQPIHEPVLFDGRAVAKRHRLDQPGRSRTRRRRARLAADRHAQHHVRPRPALRRSSAHAAEQRRGFEAGVAQRGGEQRVVLEAIAAASGVQELALQVGKREADAGPRLNRQVLEQERFAVRPVQPAQRVDGGVGRGRQADTPQVVVESHVASDHHAVNWLPQEGFCGQHPRFHDDDDRLFAGGLPDHADARRRARRHGPIALHSRDDRRLAADAGRREHHAAERALREDPGGRLRAGPPARPGPRRERRRRPALRRHRGDGTA